jgi:uncharacterized protein involved in type VI secretion and phage assembly
MSQRENGIVIGTVIDLDDPEKLGRVRARMPQYDDELTDWARLVTPMAGKGRGLFLRPEVGDEVLVAFENGDPRRPDVLGALWSKVDTPPPDDGDAAKNNWRFLVSRSGHVLRFDDTQGAEKIEVIDKSGKLKLVVDASGKKIQITCDTGDIELSAPAGSIKLDAKTVEIKSSADATLEASGPLKLKGATVDIN